VSADNTAGSILAAVCEDRVRALQHVLYRAARADPDRRFHALSDKVHRRDVPDRAWEDVRRNRGAAGIDHVSLADVEEYGVARLLGELSADLKERRYRPLPARRVFIPKPGTTEQRPLSIPPVRDRIVQAAVKIVLEPVFEADFLPCSGEHQPAGRCLGPPRAAMSSSMLRRLRTVDWATAAEITRPFPAAARWPRQGRVRFQAR
jgi:RNA-directed DNA polymerase